MTSRKVRARVLSVGSFVPAALLQSWAFYTRDSPPNNPAYTPQRYFLVSFFVVQTALQMYWIVQLFRKTRGSAGMTNDACREDMQYPVCTTTGLVAPPPEPAQMAYVHAYALGNFFLAASTLAWTVGQHLLLSQILVALNAACHLYFVFNSLESSGKLAMTRRNMLTHLVAKANAGVAVLYLWKAWGTLGICASRPAIQQQTHCGMFFLLLALASGPDPTLGIWLLLDLAAFVAGHTKEQWRFAFFCISGIVCVVVLSDTLIIAWRTRHHAAAEHELYPHSRTESEDDGAASFYDSDQIWLREETADWV